jgi:hypothetical protein
MRLRNGLNHKSEYRISKLEINSDVENSNFINFTVLNLCHLYFENCFGFSASNFEFINGRGVNI